MSFCGNLTVLFWVWFLQGDLLMAEEAPSLSPLLFHTGEVCVGRPEPGLSSLLQPPAEPPHDALAAKPCLVSG